MTTICALCIQVNKGDEDPPYRWRCDSPALARPEGINPVTGDDCYMAVEGSGGFSDEQRPLCVDVNKGSCRYFEKTPDSPE